MVELTNEDENKKKKHIKRHKLCQFCYYKTNDKRSLHNHMERNHYQEKNELLRQMF
jgi:hypothetical protein